jgi:hypothetical protein
MKNVDRDLHGGDGDTSLLSTALQDRTRRHNPEDHDRHLHRENLKSQRVKSVLLWMTHFFQIHSLHKPQAIMFICSYKYI